MQTADETRTLEVMRELTEAPGVPGQEGPVREVMARHLREVARVETDRLGSLIAYREGTAREPRVMVAAHLDEIGFMVTGITDDGFLRFQTLGGWWEQVMLAQRVTVYTRRGPLVGVVGSKPPHVLPADERKKIVEKKDMFIDIGASSREEAQAFGVRPGDPVVPICPFTPLANPKLLMAKAWDNRAGCVTVVGLMRRLATEAHPNTVAGVATVQEEVGLRGAGTSAHRVEPHVAFAVDTSIAGDTPGMKPEEARGKLGKGPVIVLFDASMVPHTRLRDLVCDTAEAEGIPYQFDVMPGGGTDAGRIHTWAAGVPSLVLGIPTRYIHSAASILHWDDLENTVRLLLAVIRRLDARTVAELCS